MMKVFIKNIGLFLSSFILLLILVFWVNNGSLIISFKRLAPTLFNKKSDYFSDFFHKHKSINLLLGSSTIEDLIIPDSLGTKWFSFTNGSQNIYNSYKFIDYYKDSVKIDTLILGLQPFDFPVSYIKNRKDHLPYNNGNFRIFGRDSITIIQENTLLRNLQFIKQENYLDLDIILTKIKYPNTNRGRDVWTRQGFSGRIDRPPVDLDSLFLINPKSFHRHLDYFVNIKSPPNLFYFDLFESLTHSLGIKVIYLITPKSKYYHLGMKEEKYDKIWNDILDSLEIKPIELWNYETMITDTVNFHYYWDETHLSYQGAKSFTTMIRKRINETSE